MNRQRAVQILAIVLGVLALSILPANPRSADATSTYRKTDPKLWVHVLCTSLQPVLQEIRDVSSSDVLAAALGAAEAKAQTSATLNRLNASLKRAMQNLSKAGTPSVKHGSEVARKFRTALSSLRASLPEFEADLALLPTGDNLAFLTSIRALVTRFQLSAQRSLGGLSSRQLKAPGIDAAIKHEKACLALALQLCGLAVALDPRITPGYLDRASVSSTRRARAPAGSTPCH
jgi:acetylglutamate synthase